MKNKLARTIMVQGTASGVGKSMLVTSLCRIFWQDGYRVSPFKAQNMSLNSYVTIDGYEIGRSQVTQAQAAQIDPTVDINPVLLKPTAEMKTQVIVQGKPVETIEPNDYGKYKIKLRRVINGSLLRLRQKYEIVVIEGAGSPAEINFGKQDLVNTFTAKIAKSPVLLIGDIDRGGLFAWFYGTLALLAKSASVQVRGLVINKFRGDKKLLVKGINYLRCRTGKSVIGIIPYFRHINLPEEDALGLETKSYSLTRENKTNLKKIDLVIIKLPYISNFTDFDGFKSEPDVNFRYINRIQDIGSPDLIIIPGTKSTIHDLKWLYQTGLANEIHKLMLRNRKIRVVGICGGYQMLGNKIYDTTHLESSQSEIPGLGLFPINTYFELEKILYQVKGEEISTGITVTGYEIHHGRIVYLNNPNPIFQLTQRGKEKVNITEGMQSMEKRIWGTYVHGIFERNQFRRSFLNRIRKDKGWDEIDLQLTLPELNTELDKLALLVRGNIDLKSIYQMMGLSNSSKV